MLGFVHKQIRFFVVSIRKRLSQKQFLIFASVIVGLSSAIAAIILKLFAFYLHHLLGARGSNGAGNLLYAFLPAIGIFFTVWFVHKVLKGDFLKGIDTIVYSTAKKSSFLPESQMYSHIVTGAFTVGTGGSAGLESPIVATGAAIGSNFARTYFLSYKERTLLLACGVAGGIAASFNAPIAGVLFALEILMIDISINAFIPLIIAAASGALLSKIVLKEGILLSFNLIQPFNYVNVPFFILLGILAGFMSLYYAKVFTWVQHELYKIKSRYIKALVGSVLLGFLILFFPTFFGEGYSSITSLASIMPQSIFENSIIKNLFTNEGLIILGVALIMLLKVFATAFTVGGGGNGGSFAPSLFIGGYLGFAFSSLLHWIGFKNITISNFTIVGMAGILSGVFYAPLTSIFLIAEITGGYELMIPLMIVSAVSFAIVRAFQPVSMDMKKLSEQSNVHTHDKDTFLLSKMEIEELIETDYDCIEANQRLEAIIPLITESKRNTFPVIDKAGKLVGVIKLLTIKSILFKNELHHKIYAKELMEKPQAIVHVKEHLRSIVDKFDTTGASFLPVVDHGKYVGFISKSILLTRYRKEIVDSF